MVVVAFHVTHSFFSAAVANMRSFLIFITGNCSNISTICLHAPQRFIGQYIKRFYCPQINTYLVSLNAECFAWSISFASIEVKYHDELYDFRYSFKGNECKIFEMQQKKQRRIGNDIVSPISILPTQWRRSHGRWDAFKFFFAVSMVPTSYNNNTYRFHSFQLHSINVVRLVFRMIN